MIGRLSVSLVFCITKKNMWTFFLSGRWCPTSQDGRQGGWRGGDEGGGAPQNRCHERLRVKAQEEEKYDRERGEQCSEHEWAFAFLAKRQDLSRGIHQSFSAGRPNFWSWVVWDYWEWLQNMDLSASLTERNLNNDPLSLSWHCGAYKT